MARRLERPGLVRGCPGAGTDLSPKLNPALGSVTRPSLVPTLLTIGTPLGVSLSAGLSWFLTLTGVFCLLLVSTLSLLIFAGWEGV